MVIILELSHPIIWLVRHVRSDKAEFSFLQKKTAFLCSFKRVMYGNKYAKGFTLRSDLSSDLKQKCERMTRTENDYLAYLRKKRVAKLVGIHSATPNEDDEEKVSWDAASDYKYVPV